MGLQGKEIVLGVTGGIACYKSLEIVRRIRDAGGNVSVIMTRSAREFVTPLSFQTLSARRVHTNLFPLDNAGCIDHIAIAERADAFLVAPATANSIAKFALGLADDFLSVAYLACKAPLLIAPAMNANMWEHPATRQNIAIVEERGGFIAPPATGLLACGTTGIGRMAEPNAIVGQLDTIVSRCDPEKREGLPLRHINVLVTSGPTQERIDAVRYLSNYSSGKMGLAIATACRDRGANVCLISGPTSLAAPRDIECIAVRSTAEMRREVLARSNRCQLIVKAAAVADYRMANPPKHKIGKSRNLTLSLTENPDIVKELGSIKTERQYLVGFAAESRNTKQSARKKLKEKNLDLIVANDILQPGGGFESDCNKVTLIDREKECEIPLMPKTEVADRIMRHILQDAKWQQISKECES